MWQVSVNTIERRIFLKTNMRTKSKIDVRTVVKAGFLVAISIVMTRFAYIMLPIGGVSGMRISFGELPIMLSGFLFGPLVGGLTGIAADLIGVLVNPQGPYFPGFTISSMMWGVIPGLMMKVFNKGKDYSLFKVMLTVAIGYLVVSLALNTLWLSILYSAAFFVLLPARILNVVISIPIMGFVARALLQYLRRFAS